MVQFGIRGFTKKIRGRDNVYLFWYDEELYLKYTQIYSCEWKECIRDVVETYNIFIEAKQKVKPIMLTTMFLSYCCGILTEEKMEALNIDKLKGTFKKYLQKWRWINMDYAERLGELIEDLVNNESSEYINHFIKLMEDEIRNLKGEY